MAARNFSRDQPRVAFVLSGGGARVASHIGALDVLMHVVRPTCVVGASAGAMIGLFAVLGYNPGEMADIVRRDFRSSPLRLIPGGNYLNMFRLLRCGRLARWLRRSSDIRLESLSPRLVIECADLVRKRNVLIDRGPAAELVVASCSLPLFAKPYVYGDMLLSDSCAVRDEPAPLRELLDVDLVVAIQAVWAKPRQRPARTRLGVPETTAGLQQTRRPRWFEPASQYDLIIAPVVPAGFADIDPRRTEQFVELGRDAATEKLPQLTTLLRARTFHPDPALHRISQSAPQGVS